MYKKFCIQILSICIIILILIGTINLIVDPFFQYHKPLIDIQFTNEVYQNAGIAKNFDYNTIITGSSMTENFRISWFEQQNPDEKLIKVPYSGGYSKNYDKLFQIAFSTHDVKRVYLGLDNFYIFRTDPNATRSEVPEYLYDNNIFNDIQYLLNKDVLLEKTLPCIKNWLEGESVEEDLAYNWNQNFVFGEEEMLRNYTRPVKKQALPEDYYMLNYDENLKNLTKYIEKYPDTEFVIFFPPYSIIDWDIQQGNLEARIAVTKRIMEDLLKYENVQLFYFQNVEEIITNLDNYKDYSHYNENINYYMFECMCKTEKHKINKENYLDEIKKMYNIVINYDYEAIFNNVYN